MNPLFSIQSEYKSFIFCKDMLENKVQIYRYTVNDYIVYKAAVDCGVKDKTK